MKKLKIISASIIGLTLLFSSCSDSDSDENNATNTGNPAVASEQNLQEEEPITITELKEGIKIDGALVETGTPPSPNSDIDFSLTESSSEAFQESGLNIGFNSTTNVAGAYIQFKDVNGNATGEYFDVPSNQFDFENSSRKVLKRSKRRSSKKEINVSTENNIIVDFENSIPAGEFCFDICIYDAENNISQIIERCITVEAWGGNSSIVGEWVLDFEGNLDNIVDGLDDLNIDFDEITFPFNCNNGNEIDIDYPDTSSIHTLVFNQDGSYYETYIGNESIFDDNTTAETCSPTFFTNDFNDRYFGNWAYNEEAEELTVIDFGYENLINPNGNISWPDGAIYFEAVQVVVENNKLVITEDNYTLIFRRK